MSKCEDCPHAIWDYEEYYGTGNRQWFVIDCRKGFMSEEDCRKFNFDDEEEEESE